jgi:hypothetical protein
MEVEVGGEAREDQAPHQRRSSNNRQERLRGKGKKRKDASGALTSTCLCPEFLPSPLRSSPFHPFHPLLPFLTFLSYAPYLYHYVSVIGFKNNNNKNWHANTTRCVGLKLMPASQCREAFEKPGVQLTPLFRAFAVSVHAPILADALLFVTAKFLLEAILWVPLRNCLCHVSSDAFIAKVFLVMSARMSIP